MKQNKRQNYIVNICALVLATVALIPALIARSSLLVTHQISLLQWAIVVVGIVSYVILHEAVHGVLIWRFSGRKPNFGLSWQYAYAGSDVYFCKRPYLVIALAPVVVWGVVLAVLAALVPADWFWPVQLIQIVNISGAGGDLYVTWKFMQMPESILVQDTGVRMAVYAPDAKA